MSTWPLIELIATPLMLAAVFVYFTAGLVKGTLGIGFPTTAVSLMAQMTDARSAIMLVVIPMVVTNVWQVYRSRQIRWVIQRFSLLLVIMLVFIAIFSQFASVVPVALLSATLGAIVTGYAITGLYKPVVRIPDRYDRPSQLITGAGAGIMGGLTGVWAPPILIYLSARRLTKEQFVATIGLLLALGSLVLFTGYWHAGLLTQPMMIMSCLLLIPSMAGFVIGEQIRTRLSAHRFERALLWFFLIIGLNLIRRAVM